VLSSRMLMAMRSLGILLTVMLSVGCQPKGVGSPHIVPTRTHQGFWFAQPTSVRVYPTTRFVRQGEASVLEARIELFDEMGDSVKGSGDFRLELRYIADKSGNSPLYTWQVDLRTLEDQRQYFDPITHTYLFRLKIDDITIAKRNTQLNVIYTTPTGVRYAEKAAVKTSW